MVVRRVGMYKSRMKDMIAPAVLDIIMNKNVDQGLHDAGFSASRVSSRQQLPFVRRLDYLIMSPRLLSLW